MDPWWAAPQVALRHTFAFPLAMVAAAVAAAHAEFAPLLLARLFHVSCPTLCYCYTCLLGKAFEQGVQAAYPHREGELVTHTWQREGAWEDPLSSPFHLRSMPSTARRLRWVPDGAGDEAQTMSLTAPCRCARWRYQSTSRCARGPIKPTFCGPWRIEIRQTPPMGKVARYGSRRTSTWAACRATSRSMRRWCRPSSRGTRSAWNTPGRFALGARSLGMVR